MAILAFQKPDKVLMLEADNFFGKFEFKPLEPGYGITVGNALRRVLLSPASLYSGTTIEISMTYGMSLLSFCISFAHASGTCEQCHQQREQ